eukprot:6324893-Prymnesium_polylepis.4
MPCGDVAGSATRGQRRPGSALTASARRCSATAPRASVQHRAIISLRHADAGERGRRSACGSR